MQFLKWQTVVSKRGFPEKSVPLPYRNIALQQGKTFICTCRLDFHKLYIDQLVVSGCLEPCVLRKECIISLF